MKSLPERHADHNILISENQNIILMPTKLKQQALDDFFQEAKQPIADGVKQGSSYNVTHMLRNEPSYHLSEIEYGLRISSWQSIEPDGFFERASSYGRMGQYCIRITSIKAIKSQTSNEATLCLMTDFYYKNNSENKLIAFFINGMDIGTAELKAKAIKQALEEYPDGSVLATVTAWKKQNHGSKSREYPFNMSADYSLSNLCFYVSDARAIAGKPIRAHRLY